MAKQNLTNESEGTAVTLPTQPETVIYCGPTLPRAKLITMSVFKNGLPDYVKQQISVCQEIGKLIVPVGDLVEMKSRVDTKGTEENRLYQVILSSRGGGDE